MASSDILECDNVVYPAVGKTAWQTMDNDYVHLHKARILRRRVRRTTSILQNMVHISDNYQSEHGQDNTFPVA
jgi:hypothetical protein